MSSLDALAALYPWAVDPDRELSRALEFLGRPVDPQTLVRASYGSGILLIGCGSALWALLGSGYLWLLVVTAAGLATVSLVQVAPRLFALERRTRALGNTPDLVARAVLRMRISPSPERAGTFAATAGEGPLAASLAAHVRRARATGEDALATFGAEWAEWFPALERSLGLVAAAGDMSDRDRERTLDRALSVVLEGTRSQMRSFAAGIRRPVTALYAFGVLLPTALVALLPAASVAGVGVTTATVAVVYDLLLPVGITACGLWLVARRPVAFPPPTVTRDHPDVPENGPKALTAGLLSGLGAGVAATRFLPVWAGPVAALGVGSGVTLWLYHRPVVAVYTRIRAVEEGLTDALALVGRRVANGVAVESAVEAAGEELDGEIGDVLDRATTRQRQLKVDLDAAFLGEDGALAAVPSPRVRASMALLALAAREGRPAGGALLAVGDHVDDLHRVERDSRTDLESITGTLTATGAAFGPMVAGSTVALADGIAGSSAFQGGGSELPWLGLVVGGYVLAFAVLLPALATSLSRGFDRSLVGYRVGRALVAATLCYLLATRLVAGIA